MTQLLLEIPHRKDLDLLLALVERLDIRILQKEEAGAMDSNPVENELQEPGAAAYPIVKPLRMRDIPITYAKKPNFLALAGIWKNRKISPDQLESFQNGLRQQAWGDRL